MNSGGYPNVFHGLRAAFKNRPVRGPGLQGFVILAISRRPRALTRRPPTILKHALAAALFAGVSGFVSLGSNSGVPCGTQELIGLDFQGRCPWLISAVPAGRSIAECGTIQMRNAETRCRRKLLRGTRSRATGTVALPLSPEQSQLD